MYICVYIYVTHEYMQLLAADGGSSSSALAGARSVRQSTKQALTHRLPSPSECPKSLTRRSFRTPPYQQPPLGGLRSS